MHSPLRIALAGMTVLAIALGIGRFLLTPLMPLMQADAGLSLIAGGWLAAINNFGYLAGAMLCMLRAMPARPLLRGGMLAIAIGTLGMGLGNATSWWLALRLLAGVFAAMLMVHGIAWSMTRLRAAGRAELEVAVFAGPGVGIVLSGLLVALLHPLGIGSAALWIVFGLLCLLAVAPVWRVLAAPEPPPAHAAESADSGVSAWPLIVMYGLLGFSYVIPATFLPLIAETQLHLPRLREWFWPVYGVTTTLATLSLRWWPVRWSNYIALMAVCLLMLAGQLACLLWLSAPGLLLGTALVGAASMPLVVFTMREARQLAPHDATHLIALLTVAFGIGQIIGPLVAAWLAHRQHSFGAPLLLAGLAAGLAALIVLPRALRSPHLITAANSGY